MFSNKKIVIAAIAAIVAVLIVATLVGYFLSKSSSNSEKATKSPKVTESTESKPKNVQSYYTKDETFRLFDYLKDCGMHPKRKYSEEGQKGYESVGVISIHYFINGWEVVFEEDGEIIAYVDKSNPDDKDHRTSTCYNTSDANKTVTDEKTSYVFVGREMVKDLPRIIDAFKKKKAEFGKNPFPDDVPIEYKAKDRQ